MRDSPYQTRKFAMTHLLNLLNDSFRKLSIFAWQRPSDIQDENKLSANSESVKCHLGKIFEILRLANFYNLFFHRVEVR